MWTIVGLTGLLGAGAVQMMTAQAEPAGSGSALASKDLAPAVKAFLADHGDLCLAWYTWPRELTAEEQQSGRNEAVQLPVLERLGIVKSAEIPAPASHNQAAQAIGVVASAPLSPMPSAEAPGRSYSLTAEGQKFYLQKVHTTLTVHGALERHNGDFCVAKLTLDKVVKWTPPETASGQLTTVVSYTYHIKAAPFMSDPEAQRVLPVVARIMQGDGRLPMTVTAQLLDGKWVPVMPGQ